MRLSLSRKTMSGRALTRWVWDLSGADRAARITAAPALAKLACPHHLQWEMDNFSDTSTCEDGGKRYSPRFEVATYFW